MIGQILNNRYQITGLLGEGAMGEVYRATDNQFGQEVAVKVITQKLAFEPEMLARFRREGESLRHLRHGNIVAFVDMFAHGRQQVIVMEYVPGGSLHHLIRDHGPLSVDLAVRIALELSDALARAHHINIIHRDIKPENVLMAADGTPKLTDFGVARLVSETARLTGTGTQLGTPYYMSPEAWEGKPLDEQADIWSLGVVLFEMLTGTVPFGGDTLVAVMNKVLTASPPDIRALRPETPASLVRIVQRMLQRDKSKRYTSMREVALDLERAAKESSARQVEATQRKENAGGPAPARRPYAPASGIRGMSKTVTIVAVLAGVLLLAALTVTGVFGVWLFGQSAAARQATQAAILPTLTAPIATARPSPTSLPPTATPPAPTATPPLPSTAVAETSSPEPTPTAVSLTPNPDNLWALSGHSNDKAEAFRHWDGEGAVPVDCARCHTMAGFTEYVTTGNVATDVTVPAGTLQCETCHSPQASTLSEVTFPSGVVVKGLGAEARCLVCHQGRASKARIDQQIADFGAGEPDVVSPRTVNGATVGLSFVNIHYTAAAAVQYGAIAHGGYEYEGRLYDVKSEHGSDSGNCMACHDPHSLKIRVEVCAGCHSQVKTADDLKAIREERVSAVDYNGNGNVAEGLAAEIAGLQGELYAALKAYARDVAMSGLVYDAAAYPYFFADENGDGQVDQNEGSSVAYSRWTPRLLKAAYNYQFSIKDAGAYAHGGKYVIELLYDSLEDLNSQLSQPIDMSRMSREVGGHFDGAAASFRYWDVEGDVSEVPATCVRCHSAPALPTYLANGGTLTLSAGGALAVTGVVAAPPSNGLACATCHDQADFPALYSITRVVFPSGATVAFGVPDAQGNLQPEGANICLECHQGRESTISLNRYLSAYAGRDDEPNDKISFRNIHYFIAGATLFGTDAKGAYEYAGQDYVGRNVQHPLNKCTDCHDAHRLNVKLDACQPCHSGMTAPAQIRSTADWNGNGDAQESIAQEIATFEERLYAAIQKYAETKAGQPVVYDASHYPYYYLDANKDGQPDENSEGMFISYNAWTPRLLRAGYNYHFAQKEPGAYAHNPRYILQVLYDSLKDLGEDVRNLVRPKVE